MHTNYRHASKISPYRIDLLDVYFPSLQMGAWIAPVDGTVLTISSITPSPRHLPDLARIEESLSLSYLSKQSNVLS